MEWSSIILDHRTLIFGRTLHRTLLRSDDWKFEKCQSDPLQKSPQLRLKRPDNGVADRTDVREFSVSHSVREYKKHTACWIAISCNELLNFLGCHYSLIDKYIIAGSRRRKTAEKIDHEAEHRSVLRYGTLAVLQLTFYFCIYQIKIHIKQICLWFMCAFQFTS